MWVSGSGRAVASVVDDLARPAVLAPAPTSSSGAVTESLGRARFEAAVRAVLRRIAAGDAYVVNLTQQLTTTFAGDIHDLFDALRRRSPAPHGTVIELAPGVGIASVSPESFLQAEGRELSVRPIKGTRPRFPDRAADLAAAEELRTSPKERAENVMIVDLERNDLGRVCEIGSVEVPELYAVEPHPTVWQLVSTIRGRLRGDLGYASALEACFPCGSVTGAPKIAAMNVIEELEPVPRGWYCGAVGWVAPGAMSTSVTIRSAVLRSDGTASYGTGSGIVADSDPGAEYEEARLKAAAFLAATGSGWRDRGDTPSREVGSEVP
ncbi:MAG: anthranilate synthase component I family protein [Actinobacteria bacterium]|nr:anthranilate synthase component I family protein [Actinomycetota bacterium]